MIYLDNAATTKPYAEALAVFNEVSEHTWMNPSATSYEGGAEAKRVLNRSRETIARLINAHPAQIFFTSGATEAANWVKDAYATVITTMAEHPCVYNMDADRIVVPVDEYGVVDYDMLEDVLKKRRGLVAITDANNELGSLTDTPRVARIVHDAGLELMTDMTQSFATHADIDVAARDCDYAFGSAHKFGGLKGVGFLYVKHPDMMTQFMYGGHQERGMRPGTENVAGIAAMATAFEKTCSTRLLGTYVYEALRIRCLRKMNEAGVDYHVNSAPDSLPNILSLTIHGVSAAELVARLSMDDIYISAGSACNTGTTEPSRVLMARPGFDEQGALSTIRVSFGHQTSGDDIDAFVERLVFHVKEMLTIG